MNCCHSGGIAHKSDAGIPEYDMCFNFRSSELLSRVKEDKLIWKSGTIINYSKKISKKREFRVYTTLNGIKLQRRRVALNICKTLDELKRYIRIRTRKAEVYLNQE